MTTIRLKHVHRNRSRHGQDRYYFRRGKEPLVRLPDDPTSEEFAKAYRACLDGPRPIPQDSGSPKISKAKPNTLRALFVAYFGSVEFGELAPSTKDQRRRVSDTICLEPLKPADLQTRPEDNRPFADIPLTKLSSKHIRVLRDRKAATPESANHRLKLLRQVVSWGRENEWISHDPTEGVKSLRGKGTGHHTWTTDEVEQYLEKHGPGSKARLALGLLLFLGIRISDCALIGPQHRRADTHVFRPYKGRRKSPKELFLPVLPLLDAILKTSEIGHLSYLVTKQGKPFTIKGLGNKMRDWCDEAKLPHCSAHGLRKAGAAISAENGASEEDLKALFGWENAKEANLYTRAASQKRIAARAISKIDYGPGVARLILARKPKKKTA